MLHCGAGSRGCGRAEQSWTPCQASGLNNQDSPEVEDVVQPLDFPPGVLVSHATTRRPCLACMLNAKQDREFVDDEHDLATA